MPYKWNSIYASKYDVSYPDFHEIQISQQIVLDILCSEFYPKGTKNIENCVKCLLAWDDAVAHLFIELRYKPEDRGFDFR